MSKPLRVLYAAGPGHIVGTYRFWKQGMDDPSQVAITHSWQFYEICRDLGIEAYAISRNSIAEKVEEGPFVIEHRPNRLEHTNGIFYHIGLIIYGFSIIWSALRFRADVVVADNGTTHWFILSLLPWLGIRIVPSLTNVLWRKYVAPTWVERFFLRLGRGLFQSSASAILVVSKDQIAQVEELTAGQHRPTIEFIPVYRRQQFASVAAPNESRSPFYVLYTGRVERDKGVFDLLTIAQRLLAEGITNIQFDVCGQGSALEELRQAIVEAGVAPFFHCHGHCNKLQMQQMFNQSHVVVVPTRTDFVESFNMVVAEAVLAGRPVISSAVCPAIAYVQNAVVEVPPDDVQAYGDALIKLYRDRDFYDQKRQHCQAYTEQFYDTSHGWGASLKSILLELQATQKLERLENQIEPAHLS